MGSQFSSMGLCSFTIAYFQRPANRAMQSFCLVTCNFITQYLLHDTLAEHIGWRSNMSGIHIMHSIVVELFAYILIQNGSVDRRQVDDAFLHRFICV